MGRGLDYWNEARSGRPCPERSDIDPLTLKWLVSHVMLWEVHEGEPGSDFVVRLAGERASLGHGGRLKGWTLRDFHGEQFSQIWEEFRDVCNTGQLHYAEREANWVGSSHLWVDRLLTPLGDRNGVTHLLSFIDYESADEDSSN